MTNIIVEKRFLNNKELKEKLLGLSDNISDQSDMNIFRVKGSGEEIINLLQVSRIPFEIRYQNLGL